MKRCLLFLCLIAVLPLGKLRGEDNLVQLAASNGQFKTLVSLLVLTGLDKALESHDELTVFAPTDEAFAKLPSETLENLRKSSGRETLAAILKAHVVQGARTIGDIQRPAPGKSITTLEGTAFRLVGNGLKPQFGNANIVKANIKASNGIVHAIDAVLMPEPKLENIIETAKSAGSFKTLLAALDAAELTEVFRGDAHFTVLAPTDEAFSKIPEATLASLLKPENKELLVEVLKYHVLSGNILASNALANPKASSLQGASLMFQLQDGQLRVEQAKVIKNDIRASNGVIHVIDSVLMPPTKSESPLKKPVSTSTCHNKKGA